MRDSLRVDGPWGLTIPGRWDVLPFGVVFEQTKTRNQGLVETNLLSLSYGNIVRRDIHGAEGLLPKSFETYQIVEPGQIVFRLTDLQNDQRSLRSGEATERGIITSAYLAVKSQRLLPRYAYFLMRCYDEMKVFYSYGGGVRQSLTFSDLAKLPVLVPPLEEQRAIADYLDFEVGQILQLRKRLDETLEVSEEWFRRNVIAHTFHEADNSDRVTLAGLSATISIPARWDVQPFLKLMRETKKKNVGLYEKNLLSLSYGELVRKSIESSEGLLPASFEEYQIVDSDQIVFRFTDLQNDQVSLRSALAKERGIITSAYLAVTVTGLLPDYAAWLMRSFDLAKLFYGMGGGVRQTLRFKDLARVSLPVPPEEEQRAIVSRISEVKNQASNLATAIAELRQKLDERKSALVAAAVTGQIDLRGKVA